MKIAVFEEVGKIKLHTIDKPKLGPDEILVKVEACAICTWEQRVYKGIRKVDFPFVGGHEVAGEIVELGEEVNTDNWKIGDKVVYGTHMACGDCYQCKMGNEQNCEFFNHEKPIKNTEYIGMGGFSEYIAAKPRHLFKYKDVSPIKASLAEPLSCCIHSVESADIEMGEYVMVFGCGIMGQFHIQLALRKGAVVIATDLDQDRLDLAKELGAHYTINNSEKDLETELNKITDSKGVNVLFNTTPIAELAESNQKLLSIRGRQVLYSSMYPDKPIEISPDTLHKNATKMIGTADANSTDFMKAVRLLEHEIINVDPFIEEVYDFEDVEKAMDSAAKGDKFRVVLKM